MRTLCSVCGLVAVFTGLALAENYTGKLLDSACYTQNKSAKACDATASTTEFALDVAGKVYKFDAAGNAKAVDAMKNHAERSANPDRPSAPGAVHAKVAAAKGSDNTLQVETIDIQ
jgi:hypothetical protein